MFTRKREPDLLVIWNSEDLFLAALEGRRSLALKWFWPAFLLKILPFLVALRRLANDLLVFIDIELTGLYITHLEGFVKAFRA